MISLVDLVTKRPLTPTVMSFVMEEKKKKMGCYFELCELWWCCFVRLPRVNWKIEVKFFFSPVESSPLYVFSFYFLVSPHNAVAVRGLLNVLHLMHAIRLLVEFSVVHLTHCVCLILFLFFINTKNKIK
jgi:hypothetical protein